MLFIVVAVCANVCADVDVIIINFIVDDVDVRVVYSSVV